MSQRTRTDSCSRLRGACLSGGWFWKAVVILLLLVTGMVTGEGQNSPAAGNDGFATPVPRHFLTNTVQFQTLSANDYWDECDFQLQGVVTLIDTNRSLLVLQDATGALALHFDFAGSHVQIGQSIALAGTNCYPYVVSFPDYPFRPSGAELRTSFEAPTNFGDYYLARMRGYLRPAATGEYTFWIASDNSSELWLSPDANPSEAREIASIPQYSWTGPHEWNRFPSQRSETVLLKAGVTYYIEARHEQTTEADNLAVAWQGPGVPQSVIDGIYLTPWAGTGNRNFSAQTNGILREYWTNFSAGDLTILSGPSPFASAVSVEQAKLVILGPGTLPAADATAFGQPLPEGKNYSWVQVEGVVTFAGTSEAGTELELSDGESHVLVRLLQSDHEFLRNLSNAPVRIQGVCETGFDQKGTRVPAMIWAPGEQFVSLVEPVSTNLNAPADTQVLKPVQVNADPTMQGFYGTHGVVTFNDRVMDKDFLFVQEDTAAIAVSLTERHFKNNLEVGQCVDLGGRLRPGKYVPIMVPLVVESLGWRSMPEPITQLGPAPIPVSRDGRWTEIEGVVHSVNSNGTMSISGKDGLLYLWLGNTPSNSLAGYVDAKLRVRGVLTLALIDAPLLLVPSRAYVDVEQRAVRDPFKIPPSPIAEIFPDDGEYSLVHRVKIRGEVIYGQGQSILIQDSSGGVRVQTRDGLAAALGQTVEAVGFPSVHGTTKILTETRFRLVGNTGHYQPKKLDLTETLSARQADTLVQVTATLLNQRTTVAVQVLELEEHQRIFTATLPGGQDKLPVIPPGSRVRVTGVFASEDAVPALTNDIVLNRTAGSLNILLRNRRDVAVLNGPPWWTLKRTVALVSTLLAVLVVALLWVHLLRRRLARQQEARLAFSRRILHGQESERQRIAVNLHDSLGQNLLVIKNQARLAMQFNGDEIDRQNRLNKISEITSQSIEEVRQITRDLRPYQLDRLGLTQAIRTMVGQASENGAILTAVYLDTIDGVLDKESEIHFYRIVQEAFNNILKHSGATEATVVVKNLPGLVSLSIRDNGKGFDPDTIGTSAAEDIGYGLSGMKERTRILGGEFVLDSRPGMGTSISIEIPLLSSDHEA